MKKSSLFKRAALYSLIAGSSLLSFQSQAYEVYDIGTFVHSSSIGTQSLGYLDGVLDDFATSDVSLSFTNGLDANGLGQLTWQFSNNSSSTLSNVSVFGYVDGEIDPDLNSSFNEYGQLISVAGAGSSDVNPDSWEIDEPGFDFGDIYDNLFLGALDNANGVAAGSEDDVSLALGFELGDIFAGETWELILTISEQDIGGLFHGDDDSGTGVYVNGTATVNRSVAVDEPSTYLLLLTGLFATYLGRKRKLTI